MDDKMQGGDAGAVLKDKDGDGKNADLENPVVEHEHAPSVEADGVVDLKGKSVEGNARGVEKNIVLQDDGPSVGAHMDDPISISSDSERLYTLIIQEEDEENWSRVVESPKAISTNVLQIPLRVVKECLDEPRGSILLYDIDLHVYHECVLKRRPETMETYISCGWYKFAKERKLQVGTCCTSVSDIHRRVKS
ncbi:hypothetical protein RYX36_009567 [Vicia faba]